MKILLLTLASTNEPTEFTNTFVVEYDPTVCPPTEEYCGGLLRVTRDPSRAREFETFDELFEYWRQAHGIRPDGEPNRPLTAYNVQVEP